MNHNLENTIALLTRTPSALDALLRGLPEAWTMHNEGQIAGQTAKKDSWSVYLVLGHLLQTDRNNWIPRARWILQFGETQPFVRVDRDARPEQPIELLLTEFAQARSQSLSDLSALNLTPADLARRGLHNRFGSVTLSQLLATWAVHDLTHLHQISRIMAYQYREAVGPWKEFLGVLHCDGHSAP